MNKVFQKYIINLIGDGDGAFANCDFNENDN